MTSIEFNYLHATAPPQRMNYVLNCLTKAFLVLFLYFDQQVGVIDNNGTIDGLKDTSLPTKVNSKIRIAFTFVYLDSI